MSLSSQRLLRLCSTRCIHTCTVVHKAGKYKITPFGDYPLTYEQAQPPEKIGVTKSWNVWNSCEHVHTMLVTNYCTSLRQATWRIPGGTQRTQWLKTSLCASLFWEPGTRSGWVKWCWKGVITTCWSVASSVPSPWWVRFTSWRATQNIFCLGYWNSTSRYRSNVWTVERSWSTSSFNHTHHMFFSYPKAIAKVSKFSMLIVKICNVQLLGHLSLACIITFEYSVTLSREIQ